MAYSGLKKMLIFIISNTEGVMVLVCPAIFGHLMGLVADVITTRQILCLLYWLMFCQLVLYVADVIAILFCGRCCCHYYDLYWQMLLPYSLLADVTAIVYFVTRFVADDIATVAVVIANLVGLYLIVADVIAMLVG